MNNIKTEKKYLLACCSLLLIVMLIGCGGCGGVKTRSAESNLKTEKEDEVFLENSSNETHIDKIDVNNKALSNTQHEPMIELLGQDENPMRYPSKIKFSTGKIIDIRNIDPYRDLPYKLLQNIEGGFERLYELSNLSKNEQETALQGARVNEEAYRDGNYLRLLTKAPVIEVQNGITAIAYHASFYSSTEDILATKGQVLIYDEEGNLLQNIKDDKEGFYDIRLSSDGQYLMQRYGIAYGEDGGGLLEMGFKFYNSRSGKEIYNLALGRDEFIINYSFFGESNFGYFYRSEGDSFQTYLVDFKNTTTYSKSMDRVKYFNNEPGYQESLLPSFIKSRNIQDLLKDGFTKFN